VSHSDRPTPPYVFDPVSLDSLSRLRASPAPFPIAPTDVPRLAIPEASIRQLPIDHRTAFVLSLIGTTDVDGIVDMSGMPRDDVIGILLELMDRGAITLA
jgi:hypothetical protein